MTKSGREYSGQAYATKCYRGPKSVGIVLDAGNAAVLAEKLLKAMNSGNSNIDVTVYATDSGVMESGDRARITVTSKKKSQKS